MNWQKMTTVTIPAFNESLGIQKCLSSLIEMYPGISILVVDDGSTDDTYEKAMEVVKDFPQVTVLQHTLNRGYGASLKTAMRHTKTPIVVWFDADLQHDPSYLPAIVEPIYQKKMDAVLGAREKGSAFVIKRVPGKILLKFISQIVAGQKIPDLNCGYRAFRTSIIVKYLHLLPDGFSASSTSTLLMIKRNYRIQFFPLKVNTRVGKSYVRIFRDGFFTLGLILRIFILFEAFFFFSWISFLQLLVGVGYSAWVMAEKGQGVPILGALVIISALLTFLMGVVSQQISEMRQERFEVAEIELVESSESE